jgi:two-component system chemotaxis sensor kinase CheA
MQIDLSHFRETFFQEAADHVNHMEQGLLELSSTPGDAELLNSVFRAAHSIKGGSATFGLESITRFTHTLESLLDRMRQGKVATCPERIRLLLSTCDVLRHLLDAALSNSAPPPEAEQLLVHVTLAQRAGEFVLDSEHTLREQDGDAQSQTRTWSIAFAPSPAIFREGMDPLLVLRELRELGSVEEITVDLSQLPSLNALNPDTCHLAWKLRLTTARSQAEIRDVFSFVEDGARLTIEPVALSYGMSTSVAPRMQPAKRASHHTHDSGSIRVSTQKVVISARRS